MRDAIVLCLTPPPSGGPIESVCGHFWLSWADSTGRVGGGGDNSTVRDMIFFMPFRATFIFGAVELQGTYPPPPPTPMVELGQLNQMFKFS